jgi:hypothetical protein
MDPSAVAATAGGSGCGAPSTASLLRRRWFFFSFFFFAIFSIPIANRIGLCMHKKTDEN